MANSACLLLGVPNHNLAEINWANVILKAHDLNVEPR